MIFVGKAFIEALSFLPKYEGFMSGPFIMMHQNREAIVTGTKVQLFTLKTRNKKKPIELSEWPETDMCDPLKAFNIGFLWTLKGYIDDDLIKH